MCWRVPKVRLAGLRAAMADEVLPDPCHGNESLQDVGADDTHEGPAARGRVGDHEQPHEEPEGRGAPLAAP